MGLARAQGATEYLVLLAVVLIIALVAIALLGFFPGTATDAQMQESRIYWQSASPLAITEWDARYSTSGGSLPYLRVKNAGSYPVRITRLLNGNYNMNNIYYKSTCCIDMSPYTFLSPGEELFFGYLSHPGLPYNFGFWFPIAAPSNNQLGGASSHCRNSSPYGYLVAPSFGFEYITYVEGQAITKRQTGKPLVIRCSQ